jgi:hypothetical protein
MLDVLYHSSNMVQLIRLEVRVRPFNPPQRN